MRLSLIAAMDNNRLIGADNRLPWHLPADLQHFKRTTLGKPVIMGSTTWLTLGRPLPGRRNIVLSRALPNTTQGCSVARSLQEALKMASDADEAFIIGGASVYAQTLDHVQRLYLTLVDDEFAGDTYFPEYDLTNWKEVSHEPHEKDNDNPHDYSFVVYERT